MTGDSRRIRAALAGNPNCGKTTIFNNITGARQHVGNYPGVTVERVIGNRTFEEQVYSFIDLPGTYSLTARSMDELVARNAIINENPHLIVNVVDASNLERNLYLTAQLIELEKPMLLAFNMADVADDMGIKINKEVLSRELGFPIVETVGRVNAGTEDLLRAVKKVSEQESYEPIKINYGPILNTAIDTVKEQIQHLDLGGYPVRWVAIKLLENDQDVVKRVRSQHGATPIMANIDALRQKLSSQVDFDTIFQEYRYEFATSVYNKSLTEAVPVRETTSDKIDSVLTNRIFGLPIFAFIMWSLFNAVFTLGAYPQDWLEGLFGDLGSYFTSVMPEGQLQSLVVDGIIGGVGSVLSFLPLILILFFGISLLEDSGYMARAAFLMDRLMRSFGLQGKSFIPLLLGFGCTVPAVMGARILDNPKDRIITILISPFMSCSARLPVYILIIGAFFPSNMAGTVMFSIYGIGILLGIIWAKIFRSTLLAGEAEPFVLELPPYHIPTLKAATLHMWDRASLYVKKAGTYILGVSILMWFLSAYPVDVHYSKDFDAEKANITASYEAKETAILSDFSITTEASKESVLMLKNNLAELSAQEEEAKAEEEKEGNVYDKLHSSQAATEKEEIPASFAILQKNNSELYPVAYALYQNDLALEEEVKALDIEQSTEKLDQSYLAQIGKFLEPVIQPLGFDWKVGVSLVAGFAAKEIVISTLGTLYSIEADDENNGSLQELLATDEHFSLLVALCMITFVMIYPPCLAALAVIKKETSVGWMVFVFVYGTTFAWIATYLVRQVGLAMGL